LTTKGPFFLSWFWFSWKTEACPTTCANEGAAADGEQQGAAGSLAEALGAGGRKMSFLSRLHIEKR
jgi:hypothetical protein